MRTMIGTLFAAACIALSGCVSEEAAADRRAVLIEQAFPNPADRQGIFLVFPLEAGGTYSKVEIVWFTDVVGQTEIVRRVQGFCSRNGSSRFNGQVGIERDLGTQTISTTAGPRQARQVFFRCLTN